MDLSFYTRPEDAWDVMYADCEKAARSIDMEQYIFNCDQVGQRFCELFSRKAKEGVRVRMLCDAVGSADLVNSKQALQLTKDGVDLRFFNPISPWRLDNYSSWFLRDHRKILVIDGIVGHVGSVGINERMGGWRDTHARFQGSVVTAMSAVFLVLWEIALRKKHIRFPKVFNNLDGYEVSTNSPRIGQRYIYRSMIDAIRSATKYIYLTTPYFIPDLPFFRSLRLAARRGVDVKLLLPGRSDHKSLDIAANSYFGLAMKSGIRIYKYISTRVLHAKTVVIDDKWATMGSCNLDNLSLKYNYEANVTSIDSKYILELKKHFLEDLLVSEMVDREKWVKRSIISKGLEALSWPIHNFL